MVAVDDESIPSFTNEKIANKYIMHHTQFKCKIYSAARPEGGIEGSGIGAIPPNSIILSTLAYL